MADAVIQVAPDSTGKMVDNTSLTVGANTVYRQRVQLAGQAATELADVRNTQPATTDYGLVVRNVNSPPVGQALMSTSLPVTMASDQIDISMRERRQMDELVVVANIDQINILALRGSQRERTNIQDRRGSVGRGMTR